MTAITTKFIAPTNFRCSRVKAMANGFSVLHEWDYDLSIEENHIAAAKKLCEKMNWPGKVVGGGLHNSGYAFCFSTSWGKKNCVNFTVKPQVTK